MAVETVISGQFDAFLEPQISPTPFPAWLAHRLLPTRGVAPDPALAVFLAPLGGRWAGWVIPVVRGVCVEAVNDLSRQVRGDCGTVVSAERGLLVAHFRGPRDTTRLLGLAPDISTHIEIQPGDQAKRIVVVTNNAWTSIVPRDSSSVAVRELAYTAPG
jgi:hypothetical protein